MSVLTAPLAERGNTAEARVLLAALHMDRARLDESGIEKLNETQWRDLVTVAGYQRVRPLLHKRLHETGRWQLAPDAEWKRLTNECQSIAMRKMRMHSALFSILKRLTALGIPAIILKGACLGPTVYGNIALREMGDLDILVPRRQLQQAVTAMLELGYTGLREFSVELDAAASHHVTRLMKDGMPAVEIHWHIVRPHSEPQVSVDELWQRAETLNLNGMETHQLSPWDTLTHICLHASFHHHFEFGLRPACDVAQFIEYSEANFDWDGFVRTTAPRDWSRGVGLMLELARETVGAKVPESVIAALIPEGRKAPLLTGRELLWILPQEVVEFPVNVAKLAANDGWRSRVRLITGRIFLPKEELLSGYPPSRQWAGRLLYMHRFVDLIRRHSRIGSRLLTGRERPLNELAIRRNRLREWLGEN